MATAPGGRANFAVCAPGAPVERAVADLQFLQKIRHDQKYRQPLESYLNERTGSEFSRSGGPDCIVLVVQPQLEKLKAERVIKKL